MEPTYQLETDSIPQTVQSLVLDSGLETIEKPYLSTLTWVWAEGDEPGNFVHWLRNGEKFFWFGGAPGTGKSTLLKHILESPQLGGHLEHWAGQTPVIIATLGISDPVPDDPGSGPHDTIFTFGLRALKDGPIVRLLDSLTNSYNNLDEAIAAFQAVADTEAWICLLVDGLDSHFGRVLEHVLALLALSLRNTTLSSNTKLCFTGVPHPIIVELFGEPAVSLDEKNKSDIELYITSRLQESVCFRRQVDLLPNACLEFIPAVTNIVSCRFLFAQRNIEYVLRSLKNGKRVPSLRIQVEALAQCALEDSKNLSKMLLEFEKENLYQAATILFDLVYKSLTPPSLMNLFCAQSSLTKAISGARDAVSSTIKLHIPDSTRRQLLGCWDYLLRLIDREKGPQTQNVFRQLIRLDHIDTKDFDDDRINNLGKCSIPLCLAHNPQSTVDLLYHTAKGYTLKAEPYLPAFDGHHALCVSILYQLKGVTEVGEPVTTCRAIGWQLIQGLFHVERAPSISPSDKIRYIEALDTVATEMVREAEHQGYETWLQVFARTSLPENSLEFDTSTWPQQWQFAWRQMWQNTRSRYPFSTLTMTDFCTAAGMTCYPPSLQLGIQTWEQVNKRAGKAGKRRSSFFNLAKFSKAGQGNKGK